MRVDRRSLKRRRLRHVEGEVGLDRLHAASRREESAPEEVALGRAALPRPARAKPLAGRLEQRLDGPRAEQVTRGTFAPCLAMHVRATAVRRNDPIRDPQAYTAWIRRHQGGNTGLCRAEHTVSTPATNTLNTAEYSGVRLLSSASWSTRLRLPLLRPRAAWSPSSLSAIPSLDRRRTDAAAAHGSVASAQTDRGTTSIEETNVMAHL